MKLIKLFEPLKIGNIEIRNRVVMPAMALNYTPKRFITDKFTAFYEARAKGGVGLIIIGGAQVEPRSGGPGMLSIEDDKYIPGFKTFAEKIHAHGVKVFAQLYHAGAYAMSMDKDAKAISASAIRSNFNKQVPEELTIDEIKVVQESQAKAAERLREAGFDGLELLGSAGYLINQFLSTKTNIRTDEYGGSLENRLRYPLELIKLVKDRVGKDLVVGIRMAGDDFVPGSNTYKESAVFAKYYYEAGIDYINVTGGWHETRIPQIPMMVPQGGYSYLAANIKENVKVPVFCSNRITNPITAEQILRDEMADAICFGRTLIAEPELVNKAKANRLWDIRKCIGCNQGCFDHIFNMKPVECLRNFVASRETTIDPDKKTKNPKKVLIIGAGPGGLEAARMAKKMGHDVTILEKRNKIGGQANLSHVPPGRGDIKEIIDYYNAQIEHLEIDLQLGVEATPEIIEKYKPDAVIIATGVKYTVPPIPGIDGSSGTNICMAEDALEGNCPVGRNVVVVGGSGTGVETAIWAAELGAMNSEVARFLSFYELMPQDEIIVKWLKGNRNVTVLDMVPRLGLSLGKTTRGFLIGHMNKLGIKKITGASITKFDGKSIHYSIGNDEKTLENVDTVILATGVKPNKELFDKVNATNPPYRVFKIGDAKKAKTMMEAIHGGFKVVYNQLEV